MIHDVCSAPFIFAEHMRMYKVYISQIFCVSIVINFMKILQVQSWEIQAQRVKNLDPDFVLINIKT